MNRRELLLAGCAAAMTPRARAAQRYLPDLPAAPARWLNSAPLDAAALTGRPVLLEFWTYGCYNCTNTLPWMRRVYTRYAPRGLAVIAVHTPEFAVERDEARVRAAVGRLDVRYPVLLDPDGECWRALGNRYWPAFYLFDGSHLLTARREGELHEGEAGADGFERTLAGLLAR